MTNLASVRTRNRRRIYTVRGVNIKAFAKNDRQFIARRVANAILEDVRRMIADEVDHDVMAAILREHYGIEPLTPCPDDAHKNPADVDHCLACAPRWGLLGKVVVVR